MYSLNLCGKENLEPSRMGDLCDDSFSSMSEARSSNTDYRSANEAEVVEEEEEEESSWTTYIVDFLINGQDKDTPPSSHLSREVSTSAVVSDKVGLKRRKNRGSLVDRVDEALEDTASSPIHTPKLKEDKGTTPGDGDEAAVGSERGGGGGGGDSRLLKERGLCLVPLSMVVNQLG